jgi:hypothetical protein
VVHPHSFPVEQHLQSPVAKPSALRRKLFQPIPERRIIRLPRG